MRKENQESRYRSERETDEEFETRMKPEGDADADTDEMRPYTRRSDLPFIRMAERYGGVMMKEDDE